jgi:hypothetical protein
VKSRRESAKQRSQTEAAKKSAHEANRVAATRRAAANAAFKVAKKAGLVPVSATYKAIPQKTAFPATEFNANGGGAAKAKAISRRSNSELMEAFAAGDKGVRKCSCGVVHVGKAPFCGKCTRAHKEAI